MWNRKSTFIAAAAALKQGVLDLTHAIDLHTHAVIAHNYHMQVNCTSAVMESQCFMVNTLYVDSSRGL